MKFPFSKQSAIMGACVALSMTAGAVRADDLSASRSRPTRHVRISRPSDRSAVNSRTTDANAPRNIAAGGTAGTETRAITGTNIPKTYRRYGHNTDAAQPVYVIDRDDPRFYGRATLSGALRGLPFASGGGR